MALGSTTDLLRRAVRAELDGWVSLARWTGRRPDVEDGGRAFAYRGPMMPPLIVFTVLSALEVVAVDVIVPWSEAFTWLRVLLLVTGVWGLFFAVGILAGVTVHPHVVGPGGLRVRAGRAVDVRVPWPAVARVRQVRRTRDGRSVQVDDGVLHLPVGNQTTVEMLLGEPVTVRLPRRGAVTLTAVHLHADDAAGLVAAVRTFRTNLLS
ncbi:hypothetical protein GCM10023215_34970 [Pseudonocardia yuanmonensis]|uniref:PH domain-containing protein n=1 Tax=Pseudonocardia yuanmonensis TaxID=1095914 RepID=A0ABP8WVS0_9PSEU